MKRIPLKDTERYQIERFKQRKKAEPYTRETNSPTAMVSTRICTTCHAPTPAN